MLTAAKLTAQLWLWSLKALNYLTDTPPPHPQENRQNAAHSAVCTSTPSKLAVGPTIPCYTSTTLALLADAGWTKKHLDERKVQKRQGFVANSILLVPFYSALLCSILPVSLQDRFWGSVSSNLASPQGDLSHVPKTRLMLYMHLCSSQITDATQDATQWTEPLCTEQQESGRAEPQSSSQAGWKQCSTCSATATSASPKRGGRPWFYQKELTVTSWFN